MARAPRVARGAPSGAHARARGVLAPAAEAAAPHPRRLRGAAPAGRRPAGGVPRVGHAPARDRPVEPRRRALSGRARPLLAFAGRYFKPLAAAATLVGLAVALWGQRDAVAA